MTHRSWSAIAAACALLSACQKNEPFVPGASVGPGSSGTAAQDAGSGTLDDAGPTNAAPQDAGPVVSYCTRVSVPSAGADNTAITTVVNMPGDLILTRQVERWSDDCDNPRLELEFSDGYCPLGRGHSLTFSFDYRDFVTGTLHFGNNAVGSDQETPAVSVRYTRPTRLAPSGTWGTCAGASGQLIFLQEPVIAPGSYLLARFELDLTACDGSSADPQFVQGSFQVLQRTAVQDVCPKSMF